MRTVLKYAGAKWGIASWVIGFFPPHHSYLEPFFGSGGVFFRKARSNIETVNDIHGPALAGEAGGSLDEFRPSGAVKFIYDDRRMHMTAKEFAARIGGRQRGKELAADEKQLVKDSGLVVVYGASDDTMIIDGALDDDVGCWDGGTFHINRNGLVRCRDEDGEFCNDCPYFKAELASAMEITAVWHNRGNPCWTYKTDIPHEEFAVYDDDEPDTLYCIGIVFSLKDLPVSNGGNAN